MNHTDEQISVFEATDGILLFGSEAGLTSFEASAHVRSKAISPKDIARLTTHVSAAAGKWSAESGRWLKLTPESAALLTKLRDTSYGKDNMLGGVLRGKNGKIVEHMKFSNVSAIGLATPAAPAVLAATAAQYALEASLDEITAYLESIDLKLDQLLKRRKTETVGQLGGVTLAIDEAHAIYTETGSVSAVTWSKVQSTSLVLQTMQAEAIAHLRDISDTIGAARGDTDKTAKALERAHKDTRFWLGVMARAIALQDRQYVLELVRVASEAEPQLDKHREGITVARAERVRKIAAALTSISEAVARVSQLSNGAKVANPINAPRVARLANETIGTMSDFAARAQLEAYQSALVAHTSWTRAARGLIEDGRSTVEKTGAGVAGRAKTAGKAVSERRDDRVLRKARKIQEKRDTVE